VDVTLPDELRALLSTLQTASPRSPFTEIEATLRRELGSRGEELLAGLEPDPVAVASIGQVHRAKLPDHTSVAVKVRHLGIERAIAADFRSARTGSLLGAALAPGALATVRSFIQEAQRALLEECDFELEAERQSTFRTMFRSDETIVIPEVLPGWSSKAVLVSRWLPGRSLDELLLGEPSAAVRNRIGAALFRFYVGPLYRHGLFHADPHPGNYALPDESRVVIYDFGCVRRFEPETVRALRELADAVRRDRASLVDAALEALGARPPTRPEAREQARTLLRGFFAPLLRPGPHVIEPGAALEARTLFRDKRLMLGLALPGELLFLFRLRFGLYSVLTRLGARVDWSALEQQLAAQPGPVAISSATA
jgi:predicted unusual protein kinase regulating ubiquinone biosynthesis (AarF/ABC1/UbiB family)